MDNVFTNAAGATSRKFSNQTKGSRFSPSYGVHRGFIKDPNWPPAQFPAEGNAASRRLRRMPATFQVRVDGSEPMSVTGNLSSGGVMFTMSSGLKSEQIEVLLGGATAKAVVIASESNGTGFNYRAQFLDVSDAANVWLEMARTHN